MIEGKVKVTWNKRSFKKGPWRSNPDHYKGFTTTKNISKNFPAQSIGVHINNDVPDDLVYVAKKYFDFDKIVVALNKMTPGQMLPWHKDRYATYSDKNKVKDKTKIMRVIVLLEDSKPGHQLWIGDKLCYGKAGQYFGWEHGTKHMAANLGETDRYTLQITGIKN